MKIQDEYIFRSAFHLICLAPIKMVNDPWRGADHYEQFVNSPVLTSKI